MSQTTSENALNSLCLSVVSCPSSVVGLPVGAVELRSGFPKPVVCAPMYKIGAMGPVDRAVWHTSMIGMDARIWNQCICGLHRSPDRGGDFPLLSLTGSHLYHG